MVSARDARAWAADGGLRGIGNSLYTPFNGRDGDDIDWDAYRALVRYCVGDLNHAMLWLTSGIAEWWSLTLAERKQLLEVAVEEARRINPAVGGPGLHSRSIGERHGRADCPCSRTRSRHRLYPDATDRGTRRRRGAAVLPIPG